MSNPKFQVGQKVKVLDGSKIERYTGGWADTMYKYVGKVFQIREVVKDYDGRIRYLINDADGFWYDERGLEIVEENKIVIRVDPDDPTRVIAKNILTGKTGVAKCSPEDEFNFDTGAALALSRLIGKTKVDAESQKPKFEIGDAVIGNDLANRMYHITKKGWVGVVTEVRPHERGFMAKSLENDTPFALDENAFDLLRRDGFIGKLVCIDDRSYPWWKLGKIYNAANGVLYDDEGDLRDDLVPDGERPSIYCIHRTGVKFVAVEDEKK